ncbi:D-2-hydroxyacid dehydrogenase family protein [Chitinophaga nivalis]|uniref:D-2-hydroxyacid dehydrogenase family protein n=1 Tax=Chitinophaga nivalis TaxID=2991709 RepID=A0ABT3IRH3_9BACT|nr:D-2-hydroxyacid dehydrogenase family protein [Chitinophaga nivalis]MCW3464001.1 D-2-hydroxyacid dehydrogenase family protein [Chitinophaga nivalis]MCW3486309.1 D-2-hydroxyacid dehydrogenase family protein [Chitinophaga nivalis]
MKIAILDDYQHVVERLDCFQLLAGQDVLILHDTEKDPAVLAAKLKDREVLVLTRERTKINEALLSQLPALKLISQTGKIAPHLDLAACTRHQVLVAEGIGSPVAPAELTWILIMNTLRQVPAAIEGMKQGQWQINMGVTVQGKTIGIWGYGKIGKMIAGYAKAFGAKVLVWGSEASRENAVKDGYEKAATREDFFRQADVVSLHLRLNEQTTGIVKAADLSLMKPTAVLINTSRAELVEKGALLQCLQNGRPGFAGLDVYEEEPVYDTANALLHMPNVVCTPHLGYVEKDSYELYFGKAFENVLSYVNGHPVNIANPQG